MAENLIIVSADSHAGMPHELWPEYLEEQYHELLPSLRHDSYIQPTAAYLMAAKVGAKAMPEFQEAHRDDFHGLHDPVLRVADMDREGVTAELVYFGDSRLGDMFHNCTNRRYTLEAWEAGARGWNRWAADSFSFALERFLLVGATGPFVDMDRAVAELEWIADHGFTGTYGPGHTRPPGMAPLYDESWEPFWSVCEERGLVVVVHAGFGTEWGAVFPEIERIYNDVVAAAGTTDYDTLFEHAYAVADESLEYYRNLLDHSVEARRPMWQLMLGGVFDRHPNLKLMPTEIRVDWVPATLRHLDKAYEEHRSELPAKRKPSEYWQTNCCGGASFIHRSEVEMRHEIGVETILFGRDYPHPEGTWPYTREFLRVAFEGVPEPEVRLMLGENAITFLDLDRARLAQIAKRIGPCVTDIIGPTPEVRPELLENFAQRSGFLKPSEGEHKIPELDIVLREDLADITA
jgi:predicted TIM-barrel fold metal-dependent hydrolase